MPRRVRPWGWLLPLALALPAAAQLGYFHLESRQNIWWLMNARDQPTLLIAADRMSLPAADRARYPNAMAWDFQALARLARWRFNAIGIESDPQLWNYHLPYLMDLHIADHAGAQWGKGRPLDVFDPAFAQTAQQIADEGCLPRTADHELVGYLSDDDIPWTPPAPDRTILAMYLRLPAGAPGREAALRFLRLRYHDNLRAWSRAWEERRPKDFDGIRGPGRTATYRADAAAFLSEFASRYLQICANAIHQADPNHLYLGATIPLPAPEAVLLAARIPDAVAVAIAAPDPRAALRHAFQLAGKPVLVVAFAPPAGAPASGAFYANFVRAVASQATAVGYCWGNWTGVGGLIPADDQPDAALSAAVSAANQNAARWHARAEP